MKVLDKKLLRDLRRSWGMLLAISVILAAGIGSFVGMLSTARNLELARSSYYSKCRHAEFWLNLKKAPADEVVRRSQIDGISEIRHRLQFEIILDLPDVDEPVSALVLSLPSEPAPVINGVVMRSGTGFTADRANEVIVAEKFAKARGIVPGDRVRIIMNARQEELIVVGTAISSEFVYLTSPGSLIDEPENYGLFWAKRDFLEDSFGFEGACNSVVGIFTPEARANGGQAVLDELDRRHGEFGVVGAIPRSQQFSSLMVEGEIRQNRTMAIIFPSFFLFVAGLVFNVLIGRLAEQQRITLGTLKALGYTDRELLVHFLRFGIVSGFVGGLLGVVFGHWMSGGITTMYLNFLSFPNLVNRLYPSLALAGVVFAVATCALGTLQGVRRVVRLRPAEAMRPAPPPAGGGILLERWKSFWSRLDIQWQMVFRGLFRRKWRTSVSVISAALGSTIVVLAFGFVDSMDAMVDIQFRKTLRSDFHLTFHDEQDADVTNEVRRLPGVTAAEPVFIVPCTLEAGPQSKKGGIIGIAPGSVLTSPVGNDGRTVPVPPGGLLMATRLMRQLGLEQGDPIRFIPVKGHRDPIDTHVARAFPSMLGLDVYADGAWLNRILGESGAVSEVRVLALQNRGERRRFMRNLAEVPGLATVTDIGKQKRALKVQFDEALRSSAVIMILFAAVIFFGSILNATLIAIAERRREIATFSALGYHDRETARLFFRENLITNITGTILGLPLGFLLLKATMLGFETDAFSFPSRLHPGSYLYTLILAVAFVAVSQLTVFRSLKKLDRVAALNVQE